MEDGPRSASLLAACASEVAAADAPDLAAWLFRRAVEQSPGDGSLRFARSACLLEAGQPGEVLEELDEADRQSVSVPDEPTLRAAALRGLGRGSDALDWARRAVAFRPSDARAHALLAELELDHGTVENAQAAADEAVRLAPLEPKAHFVRARVAHARGERAEAVQSLRRAVALAPEDPDLRTSLGMALIEAGEHAEGQTQLVHVMSRFPDHSRAARALLASRVVGPRPDRRKHVVRFVRWAPILGVAVGALGGLIAQGNALWAAPGFLFGLYVQIALFPVLHRTGTTPVARSWVRPARQVADRLKPVRPGVFRKVALIGTPIAAALGAVGGIGQPATTMAEFAAVAVLLSFVFVLSLRALFALTRRSVRPAPVAAPLDTSVCNCVARKRIEGEEAERYATDHLRSSGRQLTDGVGIFSCPVTEVPWLWFGEGVVPGRPTGALVRVSPDVLEDPDRMVPGQYL